MEKQMLLMTKDIACKLAENGRANQKAVEAGGWTLDHKPVVKFFTPDAQCTWLITEVMDDGDTLFGLCDLGMGCPEIGYVSYTELLSVRGPLGLPVERDLHFTADKTLSEYASEANASGRIAA